MRRSDGQEFVPRLAHGPQAIESFELRVLGKLGETRPFPGSEPVQHARVIAPFHQLDVDAARSFRYRACGEVPRVREAYIYIGPALNRYGSARQDFDRDPGGGNAEDAGAYGFQQHAPGGEFEPALRRAHRFKPRDFARIQKARERGQYAGALARKVCDKTFHGGIVPRARGKSNGAYDGKLISTVYIFAVYYNIHDIITKASN